VSDIVQNPSIELPSLEVRNRVLRNTYMLLAVSLIPTVLGAWIGKVMGFTWFAGSPLIGFAVFFFGAMAFMWLIEKNKNSSLGVVLLLVFTFFMGLMLSRLIGATLSRYTNGPQLIMLAGGGTAAIFAGMAILAATIKRDLGWLGKFCFIGMIAMLVVIVASLVFKLSGLTIFIAAGILILSSAYLLYDLNQIITGGETNYVSATLGVYLDVFNIFQSLLSLLGIFGGEKD
jgi:modulator of FtsH protease